MEALIPHDFIYKEQNKFFRSLQDNLKDGEVIVSLDFGENFTIVMQRSAQSNYFNSKQVTIHPFVIYYMKNGVLKHDILVVISDHLEHNTAAVHVFQGKLITHIQDTLQIKIRNVY